MSLVLNDYESGWSLRQLVADTLCVSWYIRLGGVGQFVTLEEKPDGVTIRVKGDTGE